MARSSGGPYLEAHAGRDSIRSEATGERDSEVKSSPA